MQATHVVLASAVAMQSGRSWWNRPMVWASLAAICSGGWLAVRGAQRRAEREEAQDAAELLQHPAVAARNAESAVDEAMNRLGRDWRPEGPTP